MSPQDRVTMTLSCSTLLRLFAANSGEDAHVPLPDNYTLSEIVTANVLTHSSTVLHVVEELLLKHEQDGSECPVSVINTISHLREQMSASADLISAIATAEQRATASHTEAAE